MTWSRIDDQFALHPKVLAAGNAAVGLWVRCLTQCSALKTDGVVPAALAAVLGSPEEIASLTAAGLWEPVVPGQVVQVTGRRDSGRRKLADVATAVKTAGFWITDYLHYHRAKAEIDAGGREDMGSAQSARADVRTSSAESARASQRRGYTGDARAISHPIPSHPEPDPPSIHPSISSTVPVPVAARPKEMDGMDGMDGGAPHKSPEPEPEPQPALSHEERRLAAALDRAGYGDLMRPLLRMYRLTQLAADGLTADQADRLWAEAKRKGAKPAALFAKWLDSGTWRDVLADKDLAAKERGLRAHRPAPDIGPVFGEEPKPISMVLPNPRDGMDPWTPSEVPDAQVRP